MDRYRFCQHHCWFSSLHHPMAMYPSAQATNISFPSRGAVSIGFHSVITLLPKRGAGFEAYAIFHALFFAFACFVAMFDARFDKWPQRLTQPLYLFVQPFVFITYSGYKRLCQRCFKLMFSHHSFSPSAARASRMARNDLISCGMLSSEQTTLI